LRNSTGITLPEMIKSVWLNLPAVIQFLGKIFFPFNLSVLPIMQDTTFVYGIIAAILLFLLIFFTKNKRWNFILLGFGWFLAFLLPSFIRPNSALVADFIEHRLYVPIIGIFIILLETDFIRKIDFKKRSAQIAIGFLIILFCIITLVHSRSFVNRMTFWENAAQNSPHYPLAHRNLGAMEYLNGDLINAEKEYKIALELNPLEEMAHNNLGLIYANENKYAEAEDEYKKEIAINPYYDDVYYNLGLLYWQEKKYDDAIADWKKTLELNPNYQIAPEILQILQNQNQ
jgi:tetratricopeptide (TPR) repeat protein